MGKRVSDSVGQSFGSLLLIVVIRLNWNGISFRALLKTAMNRTFSQNVRNFLMN